jgi:hypothetical protein
VGSYQTGFGRSASTQTLILYWNGKRWKVQRSPNPGRMPRRDQLLGVAATSATNVWAVGAYLKRCAGSKGCTKGGTLVEHWNGKAWKVEPSPSPGKFGALLAVAATSATNAWAVGDDSRGGLIEHWDGKTWQVQPGANPGGSSVAATSPTNAWAVGGGLIEHWDGKAWGVQPWHLKRPNRDPALSGVAATSPTNAWAVGSRSVLGSGDNVGRTLIERWNGTAWDVHKSPAPGYDSELNAVTATSATNAWAVGRWGDTASKTLIEHWNGTVWKIQKSPNIRDPVFFRPTPQDFLNGVAVTSQTNAWAVGRYTTRRRHTKKRSEEVDRTLALHWNGTTWGP